MLIQKHIEMLGMPVKDIVTGMEGVVSSVSFDLYGCITAVVAPKVGEDGKLVDSVWMDIARLKTTGKKRVMDLPNFNHGHVAEGKKGPAEKPKSNKW